MTEDREREPLTAFPKSQLVWDVARVLEGESRVVVLNFISCHGYRLWSHYLGHSSPSGVRARGRASHGLGIG